MHIPDGFLDTKTWAGAAALAAAAVSYAVRRTRDELGERQIPTLGVLAAFIFAAQMVNFPIAGGTSGHLLGAVLAAVLLGPWSAMIIMTTVLGVQCLFFQDGGITALGANVLNMGVIGVFAGYGVYRLLGILFPTRTGRLAATFFAAWVSVMVSALAAAAELALSGTLPLTVALPAMLYWHAFIGLGEGMITVAVVEYATRTNLVPALGLAEKL
ncbi:MAG: energy-coupling factor ABC transporter permease [Bacillota bacterium]|nr:energy-coupling factor ABC transporter permease [Bacillota bacterium]